MNPNQHATDQQNQSRPTNWLTHQKRRINERYPKRERRERERAAERRASTNPY